jgi:hypothetical protein
MTTKRQVKKLFDALLKRHPELTVISTRTGLKVVLKPIDHLIRGFLVWPTSNADLPQQDWFISYTFRPKGPVGHFCWGTFQPDDYQMMKWSHPRQQEAFFESVENEVMPLLKSVRTVEDMLSFRHRQDASWRLSLETDMNKIRLHAAIGRFDVVEEVARNLLSKDYRQTPRWNEQTYSEVIERLWPLTRANDRNGVAALLHDWERQFVELNELQALYEKTPFPFEHRPLA